MAFQENGGRLLEVSFWKKDLINFMAKRNKMDDKIHKKKSPRKWSIQNLKYHVGKRSYDLNDMVGHGDEHTMEDSDAGLKNGHMDEWIQEYKRSPQRKWSIQNLKYHLGKRSNDDLNGPFDYGLMDDSDVSRMNGDHKRSIPRKWWFDKLG